MAIIENLSLKAGGGIISSVTQSRQRDNTVSLFIGLGGTGTDAIRSIKTQVNERLIPDNAMEYDNPNSDVCVREYKHIKFLSVDADTRSSQFDVLDDSEKFCICWNETISKKNRPDLEWLSDLGYDRVPVYDGAYGPPLRCGSNSDGVLYPDYHMWGASGIRQVGRLLLFERIDELIAKLQCLVDEAKLGITTGCRVVVHIFSGVSGETGSGIFLDVCYAVRKALSDISNSVILGYFFMPEVNLSIPGLDEATKKYIPINGYAALQELNYCMNIPNNGGAFKQIIKDGSYIEWNCPPVDMCHLIGVANERLAFVAEDAYGYAVYTVTEYVLQFLTENYKGDFDAFYEAWDHTSRIHYLYSADRTGGYNPCMVSIGAACASIPYKEINTYLVSGMFEAYRKTHIEQATQADAEDVINKAWNVSNHDVNTLLDKIYASLLLMLTGNDDTGLQGYEYYQDPDGTKKPWKYLLETVNTNTGENDLEAYYQTELNNHIDYLESNADRLISESINGKVNKDSLIYRLERALDPIVTDINRGPQFAKNIIDYVEGANVLNLIRGLKAKNNAKFQSYEKDLGRRFEDLKAAREIFFGRERQSLFDNDRKRYEDYEECVIVYLQTVELVGGKYSNSPNARQMVGVFSQISTILDALERQIRDRLTNYYAPICDVMRDLTDTFEDNYRELTKEGSDRSFSSFDIPLVSLHDESIRNYLDEQIECIPMPEIFNEFMKCLIDADYTTWKDRRNKLSKMVNNFFVGGCRGVFYNYANMTVDSFLEKKYAMNGQNLEIQIIHDSIHDLEYRSMPLFVLDSSKFDGQRYSRNSVFLPHASAVISNALNSTASGIRQGMIGNSWNLIESSAADRLVFIQCRCGFPLQAYAGCCELENNYYQSGFDYVATHLYESIGIYDDMAFSDWRQLPTVTVPSAMDSSVPDSIKSKVDSVKELFDKAVELGIIKIKSTYDSFYEDDYSYIYGIDSTVQTEIDSLVEVCKDVDEISDIAAIKTRVKELLDGGYRNLTRTDIKLKLAQYRQDDSFDAQLKLDFLYNSPVYQIMIHEMIDTLDKNKKTLIQLAEIVNKKTD